MVADRFFNDTEHAYECGLQDGLAKAGRQRELLREMVAMVAAFAEELDGYISVEHQFREDYPHIMNKYERDMEPIRAARALISKAEEMLK